MKKEEKEEIVKLKSLLQDMYEIITINRNPKYKGLTAHSAQYAIPVLEDILDYLTYEIENEETDFVILIKDIKRRYKHMFPPKSGLSEFHVWGDNVDIRNTINHKFSDIEKQLTNIFSKIE